MMFNNPVLPIAVASSFIICCFQLVLHPLNNQRFLSVPCFLLLSGLCGHYSVFLKCFLPSSISSVITSLMKAFLTSQAWSRYSSPVPKPLAVLITLSYNCSFISASSNEMVSNLRMGTVHCQCSTRYTLGAPKDLLTKW